MHDMIEYLPSLASSSFKTLFPLFTRFAPAPSPEIRQAACSGLGFLSLLPEFQQSISSTAILLKKVITLPEARSKRFIFATENAIAAFGRLLLRWYSIIPSNILSQFSAFFMSVLPVFRDDIESPLTYQTYSRLLASIPQHMYGPKRELLPKACSILVFIAQTPSLATPCCLASLKQLLLKAATKWPADYAAAVASLPADLQVVLKDSMVLSINQ